MLHSLRVQRILYTFSINKYHTAIQFQMTGYMEIDVFQNGHPSDRNGKKYKLTSKKTLHEFLLFSFLLFLTTSGIFFPSSKTIKIRIHPYDLRHLLYCSDGIVEGKIEIPPNAPKSTVWFASTKCAAVLLNGFLKGTEENKRESIRNPHLTKTFFVFSRRVSTLEAYFKKTVGDIEK